MAPSAATINVSYSGFSPQAQAAFQYAVNIWSTLITSSVPISVTANWTPLGPGVLGSAGSNFVWANFSGAPLANVWYADAMADMLSGSDQSGGTSPDIVANFNSSFGSWYYGTDANPPAGQYDLVTVVLHELTHGLGFFGSMTVDDGSGPPECTGTAGDGCWGLGGLPVVYDCFTSDNYAYAIPDTNLLNYPNNSAALGAALQSGSVYFGGINATHNAAGNPFPNRNILLYAPGAWQQGSSYSHLDEATFPAGNQNSLMTPQLAAQEANHNPGPMTLAFFDDMGWDGSGSAVACPSTTTAVTLKSAEAGNSLQVTDAGNASQTTGGDTAAIPPGILIGLGAAAIGTAAWFVASFRRSKQRN